jgi:hypothetical protein
LVTDCNVNGIPDSCDIASGYSGDETGDGIPDECDPTSEVPLPSPRAESAIVAAPNPFSGLTAIRYEIAHPTPVRLEVYSADGRRVAVLFAGEQAGGTHSTHWDGRDEAGRLCSAGVYFARLRVEDRVSSARFVIVR